MHARPHIDVNTQNSKPVEKFMHEVLRPVLKQLNQKLIETAQTRLDEAPVNFENLAEVEKKNCIQNLVMYHQKFKGQLKEMVIAQFSKEEVVFYQKNKRELNKRINSMTLERLISQLK